jgi:copper resistance protein D
MSQVVNLYGFIVVILRGLTLALEALTVGGIVFLLLMDPIAPEAVVISRCRGLLRFLALALATAAVCSAVLTTLVLRASTESFSWLDALHTSSSQAEALLALGAVWIALFSRNSRPTGLLPPAAAVVLGAILTSHAFARIENRPFLLFCTGLHHLATAAWIGGLPFLLVAVGRGSDRFALDVARRYSRMALVSVGVLAGAGIALGQAYVGSVGAIYGTTYGVMLAAKIILLGCLLALGGTNFMLLRRKGGDQSNVARVLRRLVEVEAATGIIVILIASSMASQPPAVDLPEGRVSRAQIVERFTPRWPRLETPPIETLTPPDPLSLEEARQFGRPLSYTPGSLYTPSTPGDIAWSEYNHNWSGICVLTMGLLALISQTRLGHWAKHWPLVFLGLGLFILVRADPENWPLGPRGFWESFQVPEVMQHRFAVLLVVAFAIFEWRVATGRATRSWYALIFPAICMAGGALLFTHTHSLGNIKEELLAEASHSTIGIFAIVAAGARWLQLRLPRPPAFLGLVWPVCFLVIGFMLTTYREA